LLLLQPLLLKQVLLQWSLSDGSLSAVAAAAERRVLVPLLLQLQQVYGAAVAAPAVVAVAEGKQLQLPLLLLPLLLFLLQQLTG
jgi:hypothetical protein